MPLSDQSVQFYRHEACSRRLPSPLRDNMTEASYMGLRRTLIKPLLRAMDGVDMAVTIRYIARVKQFLTRAVNL